MNVTNSNPYSTATGGEFSSRWWYTAQFAVGAFHYGFVPVLIPTYVISITGRAAHVGIVMSMIGVGGLFVPVIGSIADKFHAYRSVQLAGLACYILGALVFTFSNDLLPLSLGGAVIGFGTGTLEMVNPSFIVGASLARKVESRALTRLNQTGRVGQLLGALALAGLTLAGWSFSARFSFFAGVAAACLIVVSITNREAAARIIPTGIETRGEGNAGSTPLLAVLMSPFGVFVLGVMCAISGLAMMYGQYPNYMQSVFSVSPALSAAALSVGAVLTLPVLDLGGRWMGHAGPSPVWLTALATRIVCAGALVLLASVAPVPVFLPLGGYLVLRLSRSWVVLTQPPLARGLSATTLGTTQGILIGAMSIGFITGNMLGGLVADAFGFGGIPWALAGLSAMGLLLGYLAVNRGLIREAPSATASN